MAIDKVAHNKRHGFTIVELMVVMVIIVLLLAFLFPFLMGYINDARETAAMSEARSVYGALNLMIVEGAEDGTVQELFDSTNPHNVMLTEKGEALLEDHTDILTDKVGYIKIGNLNRLEAFIYITKNNATVAYINGKYEILSV
ncbi:MAG: prepilin-type N-terminal cleavage/methylation domain-containing protein [Clostridiales Family XIII bacterium]|jgi:prepilin-type N-terminal cleavage/methylation domain-containing protein|nr:prepilin-type N-terminal cleavage/methylation domain-containing protein [Clostridiales Family XIII bacterium]